MDNNKTTTFAGRILKLTKNGKVSKTNILKVLRSGKVRVVCSGRYTDDYAWDAQTGYCKGEIPAAAVQELANDIARDSSGWWCFPEADDFLTLGCHSFLSYKLYTV